MKYEINETQLKNLIEMLKRVQLTGAEVPAYVDIINILNNPINEQIEKISEDDE